MQVKVKGKFIEVYGVIAISQGINCELEVIESHEIEDVKLDDCYLSNKEAIEVIDNIANVFRNDCKRFNKEQEQDIADVFEQVK